MGFAPFGLIWARNASCLGFLDWARNASFLRFLDWCRSASFLRFHDWGRTASFLGCIFWQLDQSFLVVQTLRQQDALSLTELVHRHFLLLPQRPFVVGLQRLEAPLGSCLQLYSLVVVLVVLATPLGLHPQFRTSVHDHRTCEGASLHLLDLATLGVHTQFGTSVHASPTTVKVQRWRALLATTTTVAVILWWNWRQSWDALIGRPPGPNGTAA